MKTMRRLLSTFLLVSALGLTMSVDTLGQPLWTKDARNPIMSGGGAGSWDKNLDFPFVLLNPDSGRYEMWYTGFQIPEPSLSQIGFAWSVDGISWTKHPGNPVLSLDPGQWDGEIVDRAMVLREDGAYKMWYRGRPDRAIGYATSPDGIQWTKHPGNPVFTGGPSSWETYTAWCTVTRGSADYTMWYTGYNFARDRGSIGRATSPDGIQWQRDTVHNALLSPGPTGSWDDGVVCNPSVFAVGNTMFMLYEGRPASGNPPWQVGLARSTDGGMTWAKEPANPVLRRGTGGSWDADYVGLGSVLLIGDTCHVWYPGSRENTAVNLWKVGHATEALADLIVSADEPSRALPAAFALEQNYPNPFNPSTTIRYSLPERSYVTLTVFNALGQRVATLEEGEKEAGFQEVRFDASSLASGVYLYRLTAGEYVQARKLILLR
jgi:hypothetical protein